MLVGFFNHETILQVVDQLSPHPVSNQQQDASEMLQNIVIWLKDAVDAAVAFQRIHVRECHEDIRLMEQKLKIIKLQEDRFDRIFASNMYEETLGLRVHIQKNSLRESFEKFFFANDAYSVDVVMVQIVRLAQDGRKLHDNFLFPGNLVTESSATKEKCYFKLTSVMVHRGECAQSGHFYCFTLSKWANVNS